MEIGRVDRQHSADDAARRKHSVFMVSLARLVCSAIALSLVDGLRISATTRLIQTRASSSFMCATPVEGEGIAPPLNVIGTALQCCCANVRGTGIGTGFYRDGHCSTGPQDEGRHTVCIEATEEFLKFSASVGNDLSTPYPQWNFPGVNPGDEWCLCATRWVQALNAGCAPKLHLLATHEKTLSIVAEKDRELLLSYLKKYAVDAAEAERQALKELDAARASLEKLLK